MTTYTARVVGARDEEVRCILAHRIHALSKAIDHTRSEPVHSPSEYAKAALNIEGSLLAIQELERVWECLFEDMPSLLTIGQIVAAEKIASL